MNTRARANRRLGMMSAVIVATAASGALAGCSTDSQDSTQAAPSASSSTNRQAGLYRQSQICVVNDAPNIITVNFSKKDSSQGEGEMQPKAGSAGQACAQGWFASGTDVIGEITTVHPDSLVHIQANNPKFGAPVLTGTTTNPNAQCFGSLNAAVGDTSKWDNGILKYTATREADDANYIRFKITVTGTEDPAKDGIARTYCTPSHNAATS